MTVSTAGAATYDVVENAPSSPLVGNAPLPLPQLCEKISERVSALLEKEDVSPRLKAVQEQTRISLDILEQALGNYSLPELSLAYNGGKDCLVLLILYLCALYRTGRAVPSENGSAAKAPEPIQCVYIQAEDPFIEVDEFVATSSKQYSLSLLEYNKPMKAAFADYLHDMPSVKAILVGTRRTDPHGAYLTPFDLTDHGWPSFMRVHPIIDWHYVDIWTFIRYLNIPYCVLYDRGYTSLGGTNDTHPNPVLARKSSAMAVPTQGTNGATNGTSPVKFRPAYELVDDYEERLGRDM